MTWQKRKDFCSALWYDDIIEDKTNHRIALILESEFLKDTPGQYILLGGLLRLFKGDLIFPKHVAVLANVSLSN